MKFPEACDVKLKHGKYAGQTIANVGATDTGLLYLDDLSGIQSTREDIQAIEAYLSKPAIARALAALVGWPGEAEKGGSDEL